MKQTRRFSYARDTTRAVFLAFSVLHYTLQALAKSWIVCTATRVPSSLKVYIYIYIYYCLFAVLTAADQGKEIPSELFSWGKLRITDRVLLGAPNKLITSYIICRNKH